jgi:hypothetical protein
MLPLALRLVPHECVEGSLRLSRAIVRSWAGSVTPSETRVTSFRLSETLSSKVCSLSNDPWAIRVTHVASYACSKSATVSALNGLKKSWGDIAVLCWADDSEACAVRGHLARLKRRSPGRNGANRGFSRSLRAMPPYRSIDGPTGIWGLRPPIRANQLWEMRFQAELAGRHPYSAVFMVSQYVSEGFLLHRMSLLSSAPTLPAPRPPFLNPTMP